jgi:predicted DCC family thiol-disulfide oxidoreductase YuxK
MCLMPELRESPLVVLYDSDCGFCKVTLAMLLSWDRARRLTPLPIQSSGGEQLLSGISAQDRLASWHLIDGAGVVHSAGAGVPLLFAALPRGAMISRLSSRFPTITSRAYDWVAAHRTLLGRPLNARVRAWAGRIIAERARTDSDMREGSRRHERS